MSDVTPTPSERRWFVVMTRPQQEARAYLAIKEKQFETFLPIFDKTISHARKKTLVQRPLFPCYLFVALDLKLDPWAHVIRSPGVYTLLGMAGRNYAVGKHAGSPLAVPLGVVEKLQAEAVAGGGKIPLKGDFNEPAQLIQCGDRVLITAGYAEGFYGLIQADERKRVKVLLDMLGRKQLSQCLVIRFPKRPGAGGYSSTRPRHYGTQMPKRPPIFHPQGWHPAERNPTPNDDFYHSPEWRALKRALRIRSRGVCENCHERPARTAHHRDKRKTGTLVPLEELIDLCALCDNRVHSEKGRFARD
jgi:transcriptional antiterminator RfaH